MKLALIEKYNQVFKEGLKAGKLEEQKYKYEALQNFRRHWDLTELELETVFDKSFQSSISNRLWGGSVNSSKSMMLEFIKFNKEIMRSVFRDLFDEKKDLGLRLNRFRIHMDQFLEDYQQKHPKVYGHFHEDDIAMSIYLCFNDPSQYCVLDYPKFKSMMEKLGMSNIPQAFERERFFKLTRALFKTISRDQELLDLHQAQMASPYGIESNMLLVHDWYTYCSER